MKEIIEASIAVTHLNRQQKASRLIAEQSGLPQSKVKDAMHKGAVWLLRDGKKKRLRRAGKVLQQGDKLELNYNAGLLAQPTPEPLLIEDKTHYSIWFKPYGLACQGSRWGDFSSINRWVEIHLSNQANTNKSPLRPVFLIHRLDRATSGLILLCHSKTAARQFGDLFQQGLVDKRYQAIVDGDISILPQGYEVVEPIDGKPAKTTIYFQHNNTEYSLIDIHLHTGRKHQIRKHLSQLGYPVAGDRLYGNGQNQQKDLQLQSVSLGFRCPITKTSQYFEVEQHQRLTITS